MILENVWRDLSDALTNITPTAQNWTTIATDPFDPFGPGYNRRAAADIPWLAWINERHMSAEEMLFDPIIAVSPPGGKHHSGGMGPARIYRRQPRCFSKRSWSRRPTRHRNGLGPSITPPPIPLSSLAL
jgi:hypothetical protein